MQPFRRTSSGAGPLAFMLALTAGSVWSVVIGLTNAPAGWMAIPIALIVAFGPSLLGASVRPGGSRVARASRNVALLVVATAYAQYLGAAGVVGSGLGLDFLRTLREIGPDFAFALAIERARPADWIALAAATALLVAIAFRPGRASRASDG